MSEVPVTVIERKSGVNPINFGELFRYRELLFALAWRSVMARYKQTAVGILWALIQPLLTIVVFTVIFGRIAGLPSQGVPYPLLTFAAVLPWQFFSTSLSMSSQSVVASSNMVSKIYFPRLVLPISGMLTAAIDFLIALALFFALTAWYGFSPGWHVLFLPLFFLLAVGASLSVSLWLAALNVRYRDVKHAVPFMLQLGIYVSPVAYSSEVIPEEWRFVYSLNPMVGVIDGFRWSLLGGEYAPRWTSLTLSAGVVFVLMVGGAYFFRKVEKTFADVI